MSRIAQAALSILAAGPVAVADIGRVLARQGVTRARDPGAAVRRALRDDPRVVALHDGRLARVDQGLAGVVLTVRVSRGMRARGELDTDGDLAPLGLLGVSRVPLPDSVVAGDLVAVRVDDVEGPHLRVTAVPSGAGARPDDERDLGEAIAARLARTGAGLAAAAPIARLAPMFLAVTAANPHAFRRPGRPLGEALREAGWEIHLGWVGGRGVAWRQVTEEEVGALEDAVADLLASERALDAAALQDRVVSLVGRHLPDRVPDARRRLARVLARAGRAEQARAVLVGALRFRDPEDLYEASLLAIRSGDVVSARRWANEGLALANPDDDVFACLDDIACDLDAHAAFFAARAQLQLPGPVESLVARYASAIVAPHRSYLVEVLVEEVFADLDTHDATRLLVAMAEVGDVGRDACLACAAVLEGDIARVVRGAVGTESPERPWVTGLCEAMPIAAWSTGRDDAPDQQQLVITIAKEAGRVSSLVVLRDFEQMNGAVKDAFFLPDLVEARLRRELFAPMQEMGVPCHPMAYRDALRALEDGLEMTDYLEWELPSSTRQPVRERIARWVLNR